MKKIMPLLAAILCVSACKKDPPKQYSYWTVNSDSFRTNNVTLSIDKTGTILHGENDAGSFGLYWGLHSLPTDSNGYLIDSDSPNPVDVSVIIGYQGQSYRVYQLGQYLSAELVNGKAQYRLTDVWFKDYNNPNDTVLVSGTFNQP
jgi:hypothetical protein